MRLQTWSNGEKMEIQSLMHRRHSVTTHGWYGHMLYTCSDTVLPVYSLNFRRLSISNGVYCPPDAVQHILHTCLWTLSLLQPPHPVPHPSLSRLLCDVTGLIDRCFCARRVVCSFLLAPFRADGYCRCHEATRCAVNASVRPCVCLSVCPYAYVFRSRPTKRLVYNFCRA